MTNEDLKLAEFIARDESTIQCMILVKHGIPFDVAFSLNEIQRFAYVVCCKELFENIYFDFNQKRWKEKPKGKTWGA
jgi:hypothetical protein